MEMRKGIPLGKGLKFPVSKAVIAKAFLGVNDLSCHFGSLGQTFKFDSRCFSRPKLNGPVVASLSVSRRRTGILQVYPISESLYNAQAAESFERIVVPHLVAWFQFQVTKPETAVLGYEQIIVTWRGTTLEYAQVRYL